MSTFKFRLEKVWKHRRRIVDERSVAVSQVNRRVASLSQKIVELDQNITRHAGTLLPSAGGAVKARDLHNRTAWLDHLHALRKDLDSQLQQAVKDLERSRSRLKDSWRDLEILSRLRDGQEQIWRSAEEAKHRKEMDEIGQIRAFRHRLNDVSR